jgi:carbohydrate kinase (thermoresistant glucokinase family)
LIVIVAGVSGSGKTTVGEMLAARLSWPFIDGDSLHPQANVAKMAGGIPLTDADRMPWLRAIGTWIDGQQALEQPGIVACSALKRRYREELLDHRPDAVIAFLLISASVATDRLAARHGHFFDADLLGSQFAVLEQPGPKEDRVIPIPVTATVSPAGLVDQIIARLGLDLLARGDDPPETPAVLARADDSPEPPAGTVS